MKLIDLIQQGGVASLSIVGLAKNAGKTVALNSIISQAADRGLALGLSSIGYDGEKTDILTRLSKPRIAVPVGTLIASAEATLDKASARLEIVDSTNFVTALGEVLICRVREEGQVEIAGPDSLQEMRQVVSRMQEMGAQLSLVDGALDRVGSAAPTITQGTIIATGAAVGNTMKAVLTRTLHKVALFSLKAVPAGPVRDIAMAAGEQGRLTCFTKEGTAELPFQSALGASSAVVKSLPQEGWVQLFVPGAVTDSLLSEVIRQRTLCRRLELIVPDPTHLFPGPEVWQRYIRLGGKARVLKAIRLLAVTANPTAPSGHSYEPRAFSSSLAQSLSIIPVYDLFLSNEPVSE
jgi:hypothetical protein